MKATMAAIAAAISLGHGDQGRLEADELYAVVNRMLPGVVARGDFRRLMELMDRDRDGGIDFTEFCDFVLGHEQAAEAAAKRMAAASDTAQESTSQESSMSLVQQRKMELKRRYGARG